MMQASDLKHRRGREQWWQGMQKLVDILAGKVNLQDEPLNAGIVPLASTKA